MTEKQVWVYTKAENGQPLKASWELLAQTKAMLAQAPATESYLLCAVVLGEQATNVAAVLAAAGVPCVYAASYATAPAPHLAEVAILTPAVQQYQPDMLIFPSDKAAGVLAATLGARLKTGVIAHSVEAYVDASGCLVGVVPAYGGQMLGDIFCPTARPQIATVQVQNMAWQETAPAGRVIELAASPEMLQTAGLTLLSRVEEKPAGVPLAEAEVVVCGGAGLGDAATWQQLDRLAKRLNAALACTRPPIDEGWGAAEESMIGTSGKSVRPKLYLGFGISGASHHICGMQDSGVILSVNSDANAAIFQASDYGFVGDAKEVLPMLLDQLEG